MTIFKNLAVVLGFLTLSACATVQGAGQDISDAGEAITEQSREVEAEL